MSEASRKEQREKWLSGRIKQSDFTVEPASEDASFRTYWRVRAGRTSYVLMDAPPEHEDCGPFLTVAAKLSAVDLHAPKVCAYDLQSGFILLEDLGSTSYLSQLSEDTVDDLYGDALHALHRMQHVSHNDLAPYNEKLLRFEMSLFRDWFCARHMGLDVEQSLDPFWAEVQDTLVQNALAQPVVFVHRDYHSRNLMVTPSDNPGIIDFQDAVGGPVTYDLVSLLRDCYIAWPRDRVENWVREFKAESRVPGLARVDEDTWLRWFDLMGVQRHLKAIGIFARLKHRDGKNGYVNDIPRTLGYVVDVAQRYPELTRLAEFCDSQIRPQLDS